MKTISQFAAETGVSVQTIYRQLNRAKHETDECLTEKIKGTLHITKFGERILIECLTGVKPVLNDVKPADNEEILYLRSQNKALLDDLSKERVHSREQADKLSDLASQLAQLTRNNQVLLGAEQSRTNPALLLNSESIESAASLGFKKRVKVLFTGKFK